MEIREVEAGDLKRGMFVAEDVEDNGKVLVDKETMLSGIMISQIRNREIPSVKILFKEVPKAEEGEKVVGAAFKVDEVKEGLENILLFDEETDDDMKFMKTIMSLGKSRDPRAVEAMDFVLNYIDIERARELATDGLVNLKCEEAIPTLIIALKDELPKVRKTASKYLATLSDDFLAERLICAMDSDTAKESIEEMFTILSKYPKEMLKEVCENLVQTGSNNAKVQAREVMSRLKLE